MTRSELIEAMARAFYDFMWEVERWDDLSDDLAERAIYRGAMDAAMAVIESKLTGPAYECPRHGVYYMGVCPRCAETFPGLAQGIEAPSGGETLLSGSTEGESPVATNGSAQNDVG